MKFTSKFIKAFELSTGALRQAGHWHVLVQGFGSDLVNEQHVDELLLHKRLDHHHESVHERWCVQEVKSSHFY